jgi:hypothetical protein
VEVVVPAVVTAHLVLFPILVACYTPVVVVLPIRVVVEHTQVLADQIVRFLANRVLEEVKRSK